MKTKRDPRHLRRVRLLKALYAQQFSPTIPYPLSDEDKSTLSEINIHAPEINNEINRFAQKFSTDKMAKIDLSILQLGIYEILFLKKTPDKVVIDECIELAKEFGAVKSPGFINGILGKLVEEKHD